MVSVTLNFFYSADDDDDGGDDDGGDDDDGGGDDGGEDDDNDVSLIHRRFSLEIKLQMNSWKQPLRYTVIINKLKHAACKYTAGKINVGGNVGFLLTSQMKT